jgi:mannosyltransferase
MRVACRYRDRPDGGLDIELVGDTDAIIHGLKAGPVEMLLERERAGVRGVDVLTVDGVVTDPAGATQVVVRERSTSSTQHEVTTARSAPLSWSPLIASMIAIWTAVALATAGLRTYWYDESWSLAFAHRPVRAWASMIRFGEINMVGYHAFLKAWTHYAGSSELAGRAPSIVAIALAAWFTGRIAARVWSSRVAVAAVALLVTSASAVTYAQQARSYGLAVLATVLSMLLLLQWWDRPRTWVLVCWAVLAGVTATIHVFGAFAVVGQFAGAFAAAPRRSRRSLVTAGLAVALLTAPVAYFLAFGTGGGSQVDWIPKPGVNTAFSVVDLLAGGRGLVAAGIVAILAIVGVRTARDAPRGDARRFAIWILVGWITAPVVLAIVLAVLERPLIVDRYFLPALPAVLMLAAAGARRLLKDLWLGGILTLAVVGMLYQAELLASRPIWDGKAVANEMASNVQPGDGLLVVPAWSRIDLAWHLDHARAGVLDELQPISPSEALGELRPMVTLTADDSTEATIERLAQVDRVWVVQVEGTDLDPSVRDALGAFTNRGDARFFAAYSLRLYAR